MNKKKDTLIDDIKRIAMDVLTYGDAPFWSNIKDPRGEYWTKENLQALAGGDMAVTGENHDAWLTNMIDARDKVDAMGEIYLQLPVLIKTVSDLLAMNQDLIATAKTKATYGTPMTEAETKAYQMVNITQAERDTLSAVITELRRLENIHNAKATLSNLDTKRVATMAQHGVNSPEYVTAKATYDDYKARLEAMEAELPKGKSTVTICKIINAMCSTTLRVSTYGGHHVYSYTRTTPNGTTETHTSTDAKEWCRIWAHVPVNATTETIVDGVMLLVSLYPTGKRGDTMAQADKSARCDYIDRFADLIDSQNGKGAFSAYLLYPWLYNSNQALATRLGLRRQWVVGLLPSTGKSILGKFLQLVYGGLVTAVGPRTEATASGYAGGKNSWNTKIWKSAIVYVDDDSADVATYGNSRKEYYKNLYDQNAMTIGRAGREQQVTFRGCAYGNVNNYDASLMDAPEVQKRVYILHLTKQFGEVFDQADAGIYHSMLSADSIIDRNALINYLTDHMDEAINWLKEYEQPAEINNKYAHVGTEVYNLMAYIVSRLEEIRTYNPNKNPMVPLDEIKKQFGGYANGQRISQTMLQNLPGNRFGVRSSSYEYERNADGTVSDRVILGKTGTSKKAQMVHYAQGVTVEDFSDLRPEDIEPEATEKGKEPTYTPDKIGALLAMKDTDWLRELTSALPDHLVDMLRDKLREALDL